jgi:hypothetical protein
MKLSIKLANGKFRITGLKETETKKMNNLDKSEEYWRRNLLSHATKSNFRNY